MNLQLWSFPAANDWFVIRIDPEISAINVVDEVSEGVLDCHEFSDVCTVSLLFRAERFRPEPKGTPNSIHKLIKTGTQADLGRVC